MPPKGLRRTARKQVPPPPAKPSTSTQSFGEALAKKPLFVPPISDVVPSSSSETLIAAKLGTECEKAPSGSQPQAPETSANDFVSTWDHENAKVVAPTPSPGEVLIDDNSSNNNVSVNAEKAKKVVKKTVKVVKKVIKRVPKKVVKPLTNSEIDQFNVAGGNVDSAASAGDAHLKGDNHDPSISAAVKEEKLRLASTSDHDLNSNHNSTMSVGTSAQLKAVNHGSGAVEVDMKQDIVEEVRAENVEMLEMKGSEMMEVDNVSNNEGDVEERGEKCKGLDVGEGEGGKGEEAGEGKLFKGELEAMERKKRRKTEIFVGKLDKDVKEEDIKKVFAEVGEIVDLRVRSNSKTGQKFAFLRYAFAEEARRALEKFAKVEICGKECGATPVEGNDTIFLGNIDKKWKDEDIVGLLNKIGIRKIDKVTVMIDPNNRECNRGFAFVEFVTINDAQLAYTKLQEKDVFGKSKKVKVAWAEPLKELDEEEMLKVKTVYAEFLPSSWDEEKLRNTFKKFGEIDDIVLARNLQTPKRTDFAFINFKTREAAVKCIESFDHDLSDEDKTKVNVKVSLAKPKPKGKKLPPAKGFSKEVPYAKPIASHSKLWPSNPQIRTLSSVPHYGIQLPERSSTNVELVQLLREQASWRPPHANISNSNQIQSTYEGLGNSPTNICYSNVLSGRKRQFSVFETEHLYGDSNRYPHSHSDAPYSVASSSQNIMPPTGLTNYLAYHQRHSEHPSGSLYGTRNYANNVEIRDKAPERSFPFRRCK